MPPSGRVAATNEIPDAPYGRAIPRISIIKIKLKAIIHDLGFTNDRVPFARRAGDAFLLVVRD